MHPIELEFSAEIWIWPGPGAWHFITLPDDAASRIRSLTPPRRGFGSVRVEVVLGESVWRTSIFPDSKSGSYVLPIKAQIRRKEGLSAGSLTRLRLRPLSV